MSFGINVFGAVEYNEKKMAAGQASFIGASGYWKSPAELKFGEKVGRLQKIADLNNDAEIRCMHVSLNFDRADNIYDAENKLDEAKLQKIAEDYMQRIGFGNQPFLVYAHNDAAHPHIHIVTTTIRTNGKPIWLHNIGRDKSEPARIEIEKRYGLIVAQGRNSVQKQLVFPANIEAAQYGKTPTKRAITNVVGAVLQHYKFTSLPELNAILSQFNVVADPGTPGSRTAQFNGLYYSLIDGKGKKIGVPIKASKIFGNPTLKVLQRKFKHGVGMRKKHIKPIKAILEKTLLKASCCDWASYQQLLHKIGIHLQVRANAEGRVYGLTYVDNVRRVAINGSDLGKEFSVTGVYNTLLQNEAKVTKTLPMQPDQQQKIIGKHATPSMMAPLQDTTNIAGQITAAILEPVAANNTPDPYKKKKKRKKRKGLQL